MMVSSTPIRSGRTYQVEIMGQKVERFRAGRSLELACRAGSDDQQAELVEIPASYDDPNAVPMEPQRPLVRDDRGAVIGEGFEALLGAALGPSRGRFTLTYKECVVVVALGEDADNLS